MNWPYFIINTDDQPRRNNIVDVMAFKCLEHALSYIEPPDIPDLMLFDADGWQLELVVRKGLPPLPFWRFQPSSYRVWDDVGIGKYKDFRPNFLREILLHRPRYASLASTTFLSELMDLIRNDFEKQKSGCVKIDL